MKLTSPAPFLFSILISWSLFAGFPGPTLAAEYQNCSTNQSCILGEFLYDDAYTPDASASCAITSRYPNGSLFIDAATASAASNGWYSYTASTGSTEGIYPTQICCTTSTTEYLCLDKTFKVSATAPTAPSTADIWSYSDRSITNTASVAAAVWDSPTRSLTTFGNLPESIWSYSGRSLTSFGTLIADIWGYSTRSLSNFGDLVSSIWTHDTRTFTNGESSTVTILATDVKEIKKINKENRVLLEQLINKPIIKTFIDESQPPLLSDKLEKTKIAAANLYSGSQNLKSRSEILDHKWTELTDTEIKDELNTLLAILHQDVNQKDTNILATSNWLKTSWNSPILLNLSDQAQAAQSQINNLLNDLNLYGKGKNAKAFEPALSHIQKLNDLVGTSLATSDDLSLFGFIKKTSDRISLLDQQSSEALKLLAEIKKDTAKDWSEVITKLQGEILESNQVTQVDTFLARPNKKTNTSSNKVLGLMALVDTNRLLLASNTGQTIIDTWLEEGSIISRTVATNLSQSITQKVLVKYYLPTEVKKEQIINHDSGLTIDYDPLENTLFVLDEITLAPEETQTFLVEVEDIWSFKQEQIDGLKTQVNDLIAVLKNTSSFSQAVAIKSDIVVALDKIMLRQRDAVTPENRIRAYRESSLDMNGIEDKIYSLKDIVLQSQTKKGWLSLPGGIQSVTLWGIVLIILAGFAFLIIYLNALRSDARLKQSEIKGAVVDTPKDEYNSKYRPTPRYRHREDKHHLGRRIAKISVITLLVSGLSSVGASVAVKASRDHNLASSSSPATTQVLGATVEKKYPYQTELTVPDSSRVPIHNSPTLSSAEINSLKDSQTIYVFRSINGWVQIGLTDKDQSKNWWISEQYLEQNQ